MNTVPSLLAGSDSSCRQSHVMQQDSDWRTACLQPTGQSSDGHDNCQGHAILPEKGSIGDVAASRRLLSRPEQDFNRSPRKILSHWEQS
jgi:hypothetical protein